MEQQEQKQSEHDQEKQLIDPITALQDGIDDLSLSMFEAFRKLRDSVAPESGNLGAGSISTTTTDQSPEELVQSLSQVILHKSAAIDEMVDGMDTTTLAKQNARIQELLELNAQAGEKLDKAFAEGQKYQKECRIAIDKDTCEALGIESSQH